MFKLSNPKDTTWLSQPKIDYLAHGSSFYFNFFGFRLFCEACLRGGPTSFLKQTSPYSFLSDVTGTTLATKANASCTQIENAIAEKIVAVPKATKPGSRTVRDRSTIPCLLST